MKNAISEVVSSPSTIRVQSKRRSLYAQLAIRAGILNAVAALATACVDDPGKFTPGKFADVSVAADGGVDMGQEVTATTVDAADASAIDASDTSDANSGPIDSGITPDIKADSAGVTDSGSTSSDTQSSSPADTAIASTPDLPPKPTKTYKSAPADQTMSQYVKGMELPVQQVFVVTKGKVYDAFEAFGHKPGVTPWNNNFSKNVNGADVYTLKMADLPQDPAVAGKGNFRVVTVRLSAGTKSGTYVDSLTGKKAQDGVTPLWDRAPILPVLCEGEYTADDAKLLAEAMTMTGKMEFNDNLQMMRDTYLAYLQQNINVIFANAGKSYAPQCMVQLVTPGDVKIVDGQDCPQGCLYAMVTAQLLAKWTELIPKK